MRYFAVAIMKAVMENEHFNIMPVELRDKNEIETLILFSFTLLVQKQN